MAEIVRKIGSITKYETKRYGANTDMIDLNRATDPASTGDSSERAPGGLRAGGSLAPNAPPTNPAPAPASAPAPAMTLDGGTPAHLSATLSVRVPPEFLTLVPAGGAGQAPPAAVADQRRTDRPAPQIPPAQAGGGTDAFGGLARSRPGMDRAGADVRGAIVRLDTVDDEPTGYARRLQRAQAEAAAAHSLPQSLSKTAVPSATSAPSPPLPPPATTVVSSPPQPPPPPPSLPGRPTPRALGFEEVLGSNLEEEQHTNPGVRISDLRRPGRDES
jgi:hypothetical protein